MSDSEVPETTQAEWRARSALVTKLREKKVAEKHVNVARMQSQEEAEAARRRIAYNAIKQRSKLKADMKALQEHARASKLEFDNLDEDNSGELGPVEIHRALARMGRPMEFAAVEELVAAADTDGNGQLSLMESMLCLRGRPKEVPMDEEEIERLHEELHAKWERDNIAMLSNFEKRSVEQERRRDQSSKELVHRLHQSRCRHTQLQAKFDNHREGLRLRKRDPSGMSTPSGRAVAYARKNRDRTAFARTFVGSSSKEGAHDLDVQTEQWHASAGPVCIGLGLSEMDELLCVSLPSSETFTRPQRRSLPYVPPHEMQTLLPDRAFDRGRSVGSVGSGDNNENGGSGDSNDNRSDDDDDDHGVHDNGTDDDVDDDDDDDGDGDDDGDDDDRKKRDNEADRNSNRDSLDNTNSESDW